MTFSFQINVSLPNVTLVFVVPALCGFLMAPVVHLQEVSGIENPHAVRIDLMTYPAMRATAHCQGCLRQTLGTTKSMPQSSCLLNTLSCLLTIVCLTLCSLRVLGGWI